MSGPQSVPPSRGSPTGHGRVGALEPAAELVGDALVHDQPAQAGAALAGRADRAEDDGAHGQVEVGARRDDHAVVAAQLEQGAAEPRGDQRRERLAHGRGAGRRDERQPRIRGQLPGAVGTPDHDLEQALGSVAEGRRGAPEE